MFGSNMSGKSIIDITLVIVRSESVVWYSSVDRDGRCPRVGGTLYL